MEVTRIAKDLDPNASTCFNLLKTLVHEQLMTFDESTKTYSKGLGLVELATGSLEKASHVRMMLFHACRNSPTITTSRPPRGSTHAVIVPYWRAWQKAVQRCVFTRASAGGFRCTLQCWAAASAAHSGLTPTEIRRSQGTAMDESPLSRRT